MDPMLTIAVLEDETPQQLKIQELISLYARERDVEIVVSVFSAAPAITTCKTHFDIALLDICLGDVDDAGLQVARELRKRDEDLVICFLTNMVRYALEGYEVQPQAFLIKPLRYAALAQQLDTAQRKIERRANELVVLPFKGGVRCIDRRDILYAETKGRDVVIHTRTETVPYAGTLKALEESLADPAFFRCHASVLVNLLQVSHVESADAVVGGCRVPVSRHRKTAFLDALCHSMGEAIL